MAHRDSALSDGPVETQHNLARSRVPVWVWAAFSLLLAGAAFWLIVWWPVVRERRAVALLETLPGIYVYSDDFQFDHDPFATGTPWESRLTFEGLRPWLWPSVHTFFVEVDPEFPRTAFRELRSLGKVESLQITHNGLRDDDLREIPSADEIDLFLDNSPLTDAGILHLTRLTGLSHLSLANTRVAGNTLDQLAHLPNLSELSLKGLPIEDRTLARVANWPGLWHLDVAGTRITDQGLAAFGKPRKWNVLNLSNTAVTVAGLKCFQGSCDLLVLQDNRLDDKAIPEILRLEPRFLFLDRTGITDVGLKELVKLPRLTYLSLNGCRVGDNGVLALMMKHEDRPDLPITQRVDLLLQKLRSGNSALHYLIDRERLQGTDVSSDLFPHLPEGSHL